MVPWIDATSCGVRARRSARCGRRTAASTMVGGCTYSGCSMWFADIKRVTMPYLDTREKKLSCMSLLRRPKRAYIARTLRYLFRSQHSGGMETGHIPCTKAPVGRLISESRNPHVQYMV